jgi:hypothetical protein
MTIQFNLTGLDGIYAEAMERSDPTLAFFAFAGKAEQDQRGLASS